MWYALSAMVVSSSLVFVFGATFAERDADGVAVLVAHAVDGVIIEVFGAATPFAFELVCHRSHPPHLTLPFHLPGLGEHHGVVDCPGEILGRPDLIDRPVGSARSPRALAFPTLLVLLRVWVVAGPGPFPPLDCFRPAAAGADGR